MIKKLIKKIFIPKQVSTYPVKNTLDRIVKFDDYANYGILDTSIGSYNLGDFIIMDSIHRELSDTLSDEAYLMTFPTHLSISGKERNLLLEKELLFISGTNLLNSHMDTAKQWHINPGDLSFYYKRCILFGVGWGSYENLPSEQTKQLLKTVLSDKVMHSVRDEYTKNMLNSIGINNVLNTSCPTTWRLDKVDLTKLSKAKYAVTTLTYYSKDLVNDYRMLEILDEQYETVYLWVQSLQDIDYLNELNSDKKLNISYIAPSLKAYTTFLESNKEDIDYIGTRLHAGIYAMQRGIRSLIIGIDNRALEINKGIKIDVVKRDKIESIVEFINERDASKIELPQQSILEWKNQFKIIK